MDNKLIEPELESTVYVKFAIGGTISFSKVKVLAKGTDLFFHEGCTDSCKCEEFRKPLYYEDYKVTWFKTLKEIREHYKLKKICDDYYEVCKNGYSR